DRRDHRERGSRADRLGRPRDRHHGIGLLRSAARAAKKRLPSVRFGPRPSSFRREYGLCVMGEDQMQKITPLLWFDDEAEEAANFYASIFQDSKIPGLTRYGEAGPGPKGSVMTVAFKLCGGNFVALNGGPQYRFTPAVSFVVSCETQEEIDRY